MARWSRIERDLRTAGFRLIAGVDEVGRGPLAGPVVVCAVIMPPDVRAIPGVADSKALSARERQRLAPLIRERAVAWALGAASVHEIDALNIAGATALAIRRAIRRLSAARPHPYRWSPHPAAGYVAPGRGGRRRPVLLDCLRQYCG